MGTLVRFYNPCATCGRTGGLRLVRDDKHRMSDAGGVRLLCPCGRHTAPENWNACNPVQADGGKGLPPAPDPGGAV